MEQWTAAHPQLAELARLQQCLEEGLAAAVGADRCVCPDPTADAAEANPCVCPDAIPDAPGQAHGPAPAEDLPLLRRHRLDAAFLTQAAQALLRLLAALPAEGLPAPFLQACAQLRKALEQSPDEAARLIASTVGADPCVCPDPTPDDAEADLCVCPDAIPDAPGQAQGSALAPTADASGGLARFLIWKIAAKLLAPWREALAPRLQEGGWDEPICPLCGAGPSMAQLVRTRTGRKRLLVCGCCAMRWEYQRLGCPYCGNEEQSQLSIIELEEEPLRIDCCQGCQGYIKTYVGRGEEGLQLADWSSLHIDAVALQQGWQRRASSLYQL